ncbi:alpha/beta hydrolase [Allopontixanthobacter sp.]|uniref:alpha/beta hydrolase n=1 Tax=Allopontixanthobacter sp. TaxID=2906452 RepID=UPI002ABBD5CC|nr:alpha/beta hydrolase [Allopontixanthobacter sp.]MDZ4307842.1 alpha/beta hydrolase [Allopontixanthobacter sp.]
MHKIGMALCAAALLLPNSVVAQRIGPRDVDALPTTEPTIKSSYGTDPLQFGELRLPKGEGPFPVVVVIHGGCWTNGYGTKQNTAPIASDLALAGFATWNIEYRQVRSAGAGWPGTFLDWGNATDHLRTLAKDNPLDLSNVIVVGHSAGAHAALFVASRSRLPVESEVRGEDPLPVKSVVAIDGPGDLGPFVGLDEEICGKPVIEPLIGGSIDTYPNRFSEASPAAQFPLGVRQGLISSSRVLSPEVAETYRAAATEAGDKVDVRVFGDSGHFEPIAPGSSEWRVVKELILTFGGMDKQQ